MMMHNSDPTWRPRKRSGCPRRLFCHRHKLVITLGWHLFEEDGQLDETQRQSADVDFGSEPGNISLLANRKASRSRKA
jgi:hypothetical protein